MERGVEGEGIENKGGVKLVPVSGRFDLSQAEITAVRMGARLRMSDVRVR